MFEVLGSADRSNLYIRRRHGLLILSRYVMSSFYDRVTNCI